MSQEQGFMETAAEVQSGRLETSEAKAFDELTEVQTLDLEDVAPDQDEETGLQVKDLQSFAVRFRFYKGEKLKTIKGSSEANEYISDVSFVRDVTKDVLEHSVKSKRGPKPKKQTTDAPQSDALLISFFDVVSNSAIEFVKSLAEREDFVVEVARLDQDMTPVELFTFEECSVKPFRSYLTLSRMDSSPQPAKFEILINYATMTRKSLNVETSDE